MNRTEALMAMLEGKVVRAIDPMYLTKNKHGGCFLYRYNKRGHFIEWNFAGWRFSSRSFWTLTNEFEIWEGETE
jgi:hypothetical protein